MGDKVVLPSLSLPKQKTHWSVTVVIIAGIVLLIMGGALFAILHRQQAEAEAITKAASNKVALAEAEAAKAKAEVEKVKVEKEREEAEAKRKEADAKALAAAKKASVPLAPESEQTALNRLMKKNKKAKTTASSSSRPALGAAPAAPEPVKPAPRQRSKESVDIDKLLQGLK